MPHTPDPLRDGVTRQRAYYARTANDYDGLHDAEFEPGLAIVLDCLDRWGARSVLDVGTGTGRLLRVLHERQPSLRIHGIDPVPELLEVAIERFGVPKDSVSVADGERLPFVDGAWDAVCELAVLHHVPYPRRVVDEMLRVAARIVVISDDNRFGVGPVPRRLAKLGLSRLGLLDAIARTGRGGRPYRESEGDGVSYGFSVYDILGQVEAWADETLLVPVGGPASGLLSRWHRVGAPGIVLCARRGAIGRRHELR